MRSIFVSDLHASLRLPYARVDEGGVSSDRLRDVLDVIGQVRDHAGAIGADSVFIAGDLFDQKHVDGPTLVHVSRALSELARTTRTFILPGNHDAIDRDGRMYSLQMYGELDVPGLHVLGHETIEVVAGARVHAVPWLPEDRALKRIRARAAEVGVTMTDTNLLLFHQGIRGALWDSGRESDEGLDEDSVVEDVWEHAVTGHYHRPQMFAGNRGRYLGSPLDLRFGDEEVEVRGFWVLDWETGDWEQVPTRAPRFQTLHVSYLEGDVPTGAEPPRWDEGVGYARLIVSGPAHKIDEDRALFRSWVEGARDVGLRALKLDLRPDREDRARLEVDPSLSLSEMARRYAVKVAPEQAPGLDLEQLTAVGLGFLEGS